MRAHFAVGLFLATTLLTPATTALSTPQHKQAPAKKASAAPLTTAILGTWKAELPGKDGKNSKVTAHLKVTFKKDGTASQVIETPGHKVHQWITYQIADGWITQSLVRAEDNGKLFMPTNPGTHKLRLHIKGDTLSIAAYEGGPNQLVLRRTKN